MNAAVDLDRYKRDVEEHIVPALGPRPLGEISAAELHDSTSPQTAKLFALHIGGRRLVTTWALDELVGRERTEPRQPCR